MPELLRHPANRLFVAAGLAAAALFWPIGVGSTSTSLRQFVDGRYLVLAIGLLVAAGVACRRGQNPVWTGLAGAALLGYIVARHLDSGLPVQVLAAATAVALTVSVVRPTAPAQLGRD